VIYLINELNFKENHAGYKARFDIVKFLEFNNDIIIKDIPLWGSAIERFSKIFKLVSFLFFSLKKNDCVILQYPFPKPFLSVVKIISSLRKFKICLIIHDVDILRGQHHNNDIENLNSVDLVITHNKFMIDKLLNLGVKTKQIPIFIFDYKLVDQQSSEKKLLKINPEMSSIFYCGNLSFEKSAFIYNWVTGDKIKRETYGINATEEIEVNNKYNGAFDADKPPGINISDKAFGLVWDGDSLNECSGLYGEYLKFNNPHKASLYLAMGLPLIVWSESAISEYVIKNNIGIVVNSLLEVEDVLNFLCNDDYIEILNNVHLVRRKIITGYYTNESIKLLSTSL